MGTTRNSSAEAREIEVMQIDFRMSAYRAGPEPAARSRAYALRSKRHEKGLSPAETSELEAIEARYPGIPLDEFPNNIPSAKFLRAIDAARGLPPREVLL
jgi:hypothetical protein